MAKSTEASVEQLREFALKQIKKKREFVNTAIAFVVVNLMMVAIWYLTSPNEYFWPIWVIFGWGIGLIFQFIDAYVRPMSPRPITEAEIDAEMSKLKGSR